MRRLSFLLLILIAVAVPFQAALAVSTGQHAALEQCHHDGHEGHSTNSGSHCHECCTAAAIAGTIQILTGSPVHGIIAAVPDLPPLVLPLGGIDRPPRISL